MITKAPVSSPETGASYRKFIKEITEAEAFEIMNSYAHVELPEMKPVKDFPMN